MQPFACFWSQKIVPMHIFFAFWGVFFYLQIIRCCDVFVSWIFVFFWYKNIRINHLGEHTNAKRGFAIQSADSQIKRPSNECRRRFILCFFFVFNLIEKCAYAIVTELSILETETLTILQAIAGVCLYACILFSILWIYECSCYNEFNQNWTICKLDNYFVHMYFINLLLSFFFVEF